MPSSPCERERFIVLSVGEGLDEALADEVRTDLAAELAHRGIDVCGEATARSDPAARVAISASASTVVIELDDQVTHKRVARDLALAGLPANGRALAIAIAIDELLRASWAELTLRREREPTEPEGTAVGTGELSGRPVGTRSHTPTELHLGLAAVLGYQHTADRYDAFSLGGRLSVYAGDHGWFAFEVGGLTTFPVSSQLGDVLANGLRLSTTAGLCGREGQRVRGCGGLRGEVDYLAMRGIDPEMARGHVEHAAVVHLAAVGMLAFALRGSRSLFGEVAVGGVVHGAEATDGTHVLVGVTGLMMGLHLGLEFGL